MSDQRIKIENAIACAFGIGWNVQHDGVIKSSQLYIDKRNDCIHRYADEIESLIRSHTAPRELVEAVSNLSDIVDEQKADDSLWCEETNIVTAYFQQELKRLHLFCDALRAALSVQEPKVCEWVDDDPFWIISCQKVGLSHSFHEPVIVRKWKACPYCTNPIEVKESDVRQGGKG